MEKQTTKSVYRYGADYGLYFGLYLTLMSACLMASTTHIETILLVYVLIAGLPVLTFFLQFKLQSKQPRFRNNASLWMFGICLFLFGSLICGVCTAVYVMLFDPDFIYDYFQSAVDTINNSPLKEHYAESVATIQTALDKNMLPTVMETTFSMIWLTTFGGSLLSLVLSPIVCFFGRQYADKNKNRNLIK